VRTFLHADSRIEFCPLHWCSDSRWDGPRFFSGQRRLGPNSPGIASAVSRACEAGLYLYFATGDEGLAAGESGCRGWAGLREFRWTSGDVSFAGTAHRSEPISSADLESFPTPSRKNFILVSVGLGGPMGGNLSDGQFSASREIGCWGFRASPPKGRGGKIRRKNLGWLFFFGVFFGGKKG